MQWNRSGTRWAWFFVLVATVLLGLGALLRLGGEASSDLRRLGQHDPTEADPIGLLRGRPASSVHSPLPGDVATSPRRLRLQGLVLARDGADWSPVSSGVTVRSFAGVQSVACAETVTGADGTFELIECLPVEGVRAGPTRGVVAVRPDGSARSHPVFVDAHLEREAEDRWVVLRLQDGVLVHGRVVTPGGVGVRGAECVVRWSLPAHTELRPEDVDASAPQYLVHRATGDGRFSFVVPPGIVDLAARVHASRALGYRHQLIAEMPELRVPDLVVGADAADIAFVVQDAQGRPVHDALLIVPRELLLNVVESVGTGDFYEGCLPSGPEGLIHLESVDRAHPSFRVAVGAPGHVSRLLDVDPYVIVQPIPVVLEEKPRADVLLIAPDGSVAPELNVNWSARRVDAVSSR